MKSLLPSSAFSHLPSFEPDQLFFSDGSWQVIPVVGVSQRAWRLARVLGREGVGSCGEATIDNATSVEEFIWEAARLEN